MCPDTSAEGTLELGIPSVLSNCTLIERSPAGVTLSGLTAATTYAWCPAIEVNGLRANVADCETRPLDGVTNWVIPSLGVEVAGSGSGSEESSALVNLILHTIRRATHRDVINATPLSVSITLEHTRVAPGTPIKGTAIFTNRSGTSILVEACAANGWLEVGLANRQIAYNPAYTAIARRAFSSSTNLMRSATPEWIWDGVRPATWSPSFWSSSMAWRTPTRGCS